MTEATARRPGSLYGIGVGPGDPELMTLKAHRLLRSCDVVAHFAARGRPGNAWTVIAAELRDGQRELRLEYPVTTEAVPAGTSYETLLVDFYDASAKQVAELLDAGLDVAVACEGDPFFYGSYMYMHNRLAGEYATEVVPAVPSFAAGSAALGAPLVCRDEVLCVLSGVLPEDELVARLRTAGAAVVMKLGRNLPKVRAAVERAGLLAHAHYVERATMATERILPLADVDPASAPYFSMVVIPSRTASQR
jgi:precorrin-2/cobalt-factor-2 C20-methyltransferase